MTEEAERAYRKALFILERRDYTLVEMRKKLLDKEFSEECVGMVLERLKEYGFINDRRFTEQYIRYHATTQSKRKLSIKLLQKGISAELFTSVYEELSKEAEGDPEQEALEKAVEAALRKTERKGYSIENLPSEEKNRIIAGLYRKGFSVTKIKAQLFKAVNS